MGGVNWLMSGESEGGGWGVDREGGEGKGRKKIK